MNQSNPKVRCAFSIGHTPTQAATFVSRWLANAHSPPLAVWCEPVNGRSPISGFVGLGTAQDITRMLQPLSAPSLYEARLFFPEGTLHLVTQGNGVRWVAWWEDKQGVVPQWCPENGSPPGSATMLCRTRRIVLRGAASTRPDSIDRGLQGAGTLGQSVTAIEYYERATLRWWRLDPHDTGSIV